MVLVSFCWMYRQIAYQRGPDPSGVTLFKRINCLPDLQTEDKTVLLQRIGRMRLAEEEWYCAAQWDDAYFSHAVKVLQENGLLMTQLHRLPGEYPDPYGDLPASAANFIKVVEVAPLLTIDPNALREIQEQAGLNISLPDHDTLAKIAATINVDRPATIRDPLPQAYELKSDNPRIRLITNISVNFSLRELSFNIYNQWHSDPELERTAAALKVLAGSTMVDPLTSKNPLMTLIAFNELAYLHAAQNPPEYLFSIHTLRPDLPDLDMVVLSNPEMFKGLPVLGDRNGYFDVESSRIYAKVDAVAPLLSGHIDQGKVNARLLAAHPASLDHEFFHYLFFRPSISFSGFIVEGEATAYGEYERQMVETGMRSGSELNDLYMKRLAPSGITKNEERRLKELEDESVRTSDPTAVQCECALLLYKSHVVTKRPLPLDILLSFTTPDFQSGKDPDIAARYAQAWAVYHVDLLLQKGWGKELESIAGKLRSEPRPGDHDREFLLTVSNDTLEWLDNFVEGHSAKCEEILKKDGSTGRQSAPASASSGR
jgi:hypothetical protein